MPVQPQFLAYVLEQLGALSALRSNRMFGGVGLYSDGLFFGLIDDDTVFFKTDDSNIAPYRERNMPRFMPFPDRPEAVLGYHQVPADVIEDAETFVDWARRSVAVALAAQARKAARPRKKASPRKSAARKAPGKKSVGKKLPAKRMARKPARKK
jgi:DNA transformation protein and related proteins